MTTRTPAAEASSQTTAKDGPGAGQTAPSLSYTAELGGRVRGRLTWVFLEVHAQHDSDAHCVPIHASRPWSSEQGLTQVERPNSDVIRVESSIAAISSSAGRRAKRLAASNT